MMHVRTTALGPVVVLVVAGLFAAAPAALAADDDYDTESRTVSTQGLDLSKSAGQATLHHRIVIAAARVCRNGDTRDFRSIGGYDQCREQAIADAWAQAKILIARSGAATMAVADAGTSRP